MNRYGIIILAAGASTRLGQPKQLLQWKGKSLLQHAVETAGELIKPLVVLGANGEQLKAELDPATVNIVHNPSWQEGIASSIRCGLYAFLNEEDPFPELVIFMVCDQPYVTAGLLRELISEHQKTGKAIVASAYENTIGIPALFDKRIFVQLLDLQGDTGAKKIIQKNADQLATVSFPQGNIDIDTSEEYLELVRNQKPEV